MFNRHKSTYYVRTDKFLECLDKALDETLEAFDPETCTALTYFVTGLIERIEDSKWATKEEIEEWRNIC